MDSMCPHSNRKSVSVKLTCDEWDEWPWTILVTTDS